jgi:hypothetical protein
MLLQCLRLGAQVSRTPHPLSLATTSSHASRKHLLHDTPTWGIISAIVDNAAFAEAYNGCAELYDKDELEKSIGKA